MDEWLVALVIGGLLGAYGAILGCYLYIFNVERAVCGRMDSLINGMEARLDTSMNQFNTKLDKVAGDLQFLRGKHAGQDDSDVRRLG